MKTTKPMLEYLATCSTVSLESFELARLNDRANLRKHMTELLDEIIEVDIQARVAEWVLLQRRRQEEARFSRRARRSSGTFGGADPLPLFPEKDAAEEQFSLPALKKNSVISVLSNAIEESPANLRRTPGPLPEKSKRIA